jgi:hypothetical protein
LPARINDYVGAEAAVRLIDAFVESLNVVGLGFVRVARPARRRGVACRRPAVYRGPWRR